MRLLIEGGFLAGDPEAAYDRLRSASGEPPPRNGKGVAAIDALRSVVADLAPGVFVSHALMVTAPHTHWHPAPVIETWSPVEGRYWIGPDQDFGEVRPISFVFTPNGAKPYEWAEASVLEPLADLERAYGIIDQVARRVTDRGWCLPAPVALSVNHRFKAIGDPAFCSTMEIPDPASGLSYVVPDRFESLSRWTAGGQVGWPVVEPPLVAEAEVAAKARLDGILATFAPKEAAQLFGELRDLATRDESEVS